MLSDLTLCDDSVTVSDASKVAEETTEPNKHVGLIRPTKDLSIWIDEDQVNETVKVRKAFKSC